MVYFFFILYILYFYYKSINDCKTNKSIFGGLQLIKGLPEKLKELRRKYNLSQKEVAKMLDVSPSVISSYETGERTPSTEMLLSLAYLYKCSTDYLLGKEKEDPIMQLDITGLSKDQIHAITNLIKVMKFH